jgi:hypothetical protein
MAATIGGSWRLIAHEEDDAEYGDEWSFNYELRRLGCMAAEEWEIHRAWRQVLERQMFRVRIGRVAEEREVRRAMCEGEGRQIVPEESRSV